MSRNKESLLHSFNAQVDYYRSYIKGNKNYIFKGVFADLGISGTKENREQFNLLLEECRKGEIDLIITKSISRFARNTATLLKTIRELKSLHVDVYFEEQKLHSISQEGEFMLTILASMAQEEARDMSENVKWAVLKHFNEGKVYSMTVLGYRIQNGILVIEPTEAETVRKIFSLFLEGYGSKSIAKIINEMNLKSRYKRQMTYTSVIYVLRNETYIGNLTLQTTYRENFITKKTLKNTGQKRMWRVEEAHEPVTAGKILAVAEPQASTDHGEHEDRHEDRCDGSVFDQAVKDKEYEVKDRDLYDIPHVGVDQRPAGKDSEDLPAFELRAAGAQRQGKYQDTHIKRHQDRDIAFFQKALQVVLFILQAGVKAVAREEKEDADEKDAAAGQKLQRACFIHKFLA